MAGSGFTAMTSSLSNTTNFPSSQRGPTATRDELFKCGRLVAVRALEEKDLFRGRSPCLSNWIVVLSGSFT